LVRYIHALQSSIHPISLPSVVLLTKEGPTHSVRPSPTKSNPVQPNPTTPPPPGKEIGKETVKFLAIFDQEDFTEGNKGNEEERRGAHPVTGTKPANCKVAERGTSRPAADLSTLQPQENPKVSFATAAAASRAVSRSVIVDALLPLQTMIGVWTLVG